MIEKYLGLETDWVIIGLAAVVVLLLLFQMIDLFRFAKMKKNIRLLQEFQMPAKNRKKKSPSASIEDITFGIKNENFTKSGVVKYDAFEENGGKLSFSLAMLTERENGYMITSIHSKDGCYTYIKEIIGGRSVTLLSPEEERALNQAKEGY